MPEEIINKVALSKLLTFDLEALYPEGNRAVLDISPWLHEGLILREQDFRDAIARHHWEQYTGSHLALTCSTGAIVPAWAYMLISTCLQPYAGKVVIGDAEALETALYQDSLKELDLNKYLDKSVIIKGCSNKPVPPNAYLWAAAALRPYARKIFYGEACSSVPLYRRK